MTAVLWHIELSPYSEKVRWALDYKDIRYEARVPMPGLHGFRAVVLTRGAHRRLPVLDLNGTRVWDSTAIIAALEAERPTPALYPADPDERAQALAHEEWFDEQLGPNMRRLVWFHTLPDTDATTAALFTTGSPARERLLRMTAPVARRAVSADYAISAETAESARRVLFEALDRIEAAIGPSGYLVGDEFSVADLTGAALFTPLIAPPERPYAPDLLPAAVEDLRGELLARPGGEWVVDMYARHRRARVTA